MLAAVTVRLTDAQNIPPLPDVTPAGKLLEYLGAGHYRLVMQPTFEEKYPAAYVTTDLWQGFDEVWVQPLYLQVSGFSADGAPVLFPPGESKSWPIFSVGPKSRFYSPYWEVLYVQIPSDSSGYTSASDLLTDRHRLPPFRSGGARTASLFVTDLAIEAPEINRNLNPALPPPPEVGLSATRHQGYLDGTPINYLDFGMNQFQWNADRVVAEVPLYELAFRNGDGQRQPFGGPKIGGNAPPFSGRQPQPVSNAGQPRYGGYWRLYTVEVPASARIFAPTQFPLFHDLLVKNHVPLAEGEGDVAAAAPEMVRPFVGLVTLDDGCFASYQALSHCDSWLNNQGRLEGELDVTAFTRTDVTVTCPFVSLNDVPFNQPSAGIAPSAP